MTQSMTQHCFGRRDGSVAMSRVGATYDDEWVGERKTMGHGGDRQDNQRLLP